MTGLILKDLLCMRRVGKVLLGLLAFYVVLFLATGGDEAVGVLSGMTVLMTALLSINAFAFDELAKWRPYELSLPVPKNRIVLSRYLLALLFAACAAVLSLLLELVIFRSLSPDQLVSVLASLEAALVFCAVLFPVIYKYGTQKARFVMMAVVMIPVLFVLLWQKTNVPGPSGFGLDLLLLLRLSPLVTAAAYLLSFWLSCRIFRKKED